MVIEQRKRDKSSTGKLSTHLVMDIDEVFTKYAEFGSHQKKIFAALNLLMIYTAFHNVHNAFLGAEPKFLCVQKGKTFEGCPKVGICDSYKFPGHDFTSIVSEWSLVCGDSYKAQLVQSVYMAGIFVGSFLFGKIADAYGRKRILIISIIGMAFTSMCGMFATTYKYYITMRFVSAMFNAGWSLVSFVTLAEILGPSKRGLTGMSIPTFFAVGIPVFALLAYYIRDWRTLTFVTSLPGFVGIYFIWLIPESPRWLYSVGRVSEAQAVLRYIIVKNTGQLSKEPIVLKQQSKSNGNDPSSSDGFLSLLTVPLLRMYTFTNIFVWFVNCCVYYGLTIGVGNLGGDMYLSIAMSGLVELPAYILAWYMIESRLGRKWSMVLSMLIGGIFCLMMLVIPQDQTVLRSSAALIGKMTISCSFSTAWLFSAELYPTSIRNQGLSLCTGSSRIGGMVAPMILQLATVYPAIDFATFGVLSFIAGLIALKLPETRKQPMYETINDLLQGQNQKSEVHTVRRISEDQVRLLQQEIEGNNAAENKE